MTLALLITATAGAWAQGAFSSDPYTSTTEFNSVSVKSSMTLNINEGVIVTVNSGLTIEDGVTLTLTGGGRLSVFGKSALYLEKVEIGEEMPLTKKVLLSTRLHQVEMVTQPSSLMTMPK